MSRRPRTFCPALEIRSVSNPAGGSLDISSPEAQGLLSRALRLVGHTFPLGHLSAPHSLILGTPGSGKTLAQKLFMASLLSDGGTGLTYRAAVFDPKCELYPFFANMGIAEEHIIVTHPYDTRCVAWHLPDDFTEPAHAQTFANSFFPRRPMTDNKNSEDFWTNAANDILQKLIVGLMTILPDVWELRDLTQICAHPDSIRQVLQKTKSGSDSYTLYLDPHLHKSLPGSVLATIRSHMSFFEELGLLLHNRETVFSINKWRKGSGVLLLGHDTQRPTQIGTFNNLLIKRMSEIVLAPEWPETPIDLTWLFFDELVEAGEFPGFHRLLNFGRGKGVRVMLGFCDVAGLKQAFDEHEALLALVDNKVFFHLGSYATALWASDLCGTTEEDKTGLGIDHLGRTSHHITPDQPHVRILPSEFMDLPLADGGALNGFILAPGIGCFDTHLTAEQVDANLPPRLPGDDKKRKIERPICDQQEKPWTRADFGQARLTPPPGYKDIEDDEKPPPRIFRY